MISNSISKAALATLMVTGTVAMGATNDDRLVNTQEMPRLKYNSVEVNPVAVALSATPGIGVISASWEQYLGDKWAGYFMAGYGDLEMDNDWLEEAKDDSDGAVLESGYGSVYELGTRYYEDPIGDSFYGSAGISYAESKSKWSYEDSIVKSSLYSVTPNVGAGYRWVWNSGLIMRAALGAGFPYNTGETVRATLAGVSAQEAIDDVNDYNDQDVIPKLDVGLGYTF